MLCRALKSWQIKRNTNDAIVNIIHICILIMNNILNLISVINGLQYGVVSNLYAFSIIETLILPSTLSNFYKTVLSLINRFSFLAALFLIKILLTKLSKLKIIKLSIIAALGSAFMVILSAQTSVTLIITKMIIGFSSSMLTTLLPMLVADLSTHGG